MLFSPIFQNILRIKAIWILFLFSFYPLLIFIAEITNSNFLQLESTNGQKMAFIELLIGIHDTQQQFILPIIIIGFIFSTQFYDEINTGRLIFFKDIKRNLIFNSKLVSLLMIYFVYIFNLVISSLIVFKFYAVRHGIATNTLFYSDDLFNKQLILHLIAGIGIEILLIFIALLLSTKFNTGLTIVGIIISTMVIRASVLFDKVKYIFPTGHYNIKQVDEFNSSLLIIVALIVIYTVILYLISSKIFKNTQY